MAQQVTEGPWAGYELSVTRALGHKNVLEHGVVAEPYVMTRDLIQQHCCLVRGRSRGGASAYAHEQGGDGTAALAQPLRGCPLVLPAAM